MKTTSLIRVWAFAAAALAATACGSVSNPKADAGAGGSDAAPAGDFNLVVNPGDVTIGITGTSTVAVDVARGTGFTDAVSLSLSGLPTGVTGAFDLTSVPDGTSTTNLVLTVDETANAGTSTLTVTATGGARTHMATIELTLTTINVAGKVRNNRPNLTVRIVGHASVVSDATGNFTFSNVKVPYDIYVVAQEGPTASPEPAVFYYKGLTRPDPTITAPTTTSNIGVAGFFSSRRITGTRSGTGDNTSPHVVILSASGKDADGMTAAGVYDFTGTWGGFMSSCTTCTLYGLQWSVGARGEPTAYLGYDAKSPTFSHAADNVVNLVFAQPSSADITGTITQPAGFPQPTFTLTQQFGNNEHPLWVSAATTNPAAKIPVIAAGKTTLHAISAGVGANAGREVQLVFPGLNANTDVTYTLPTPPVLMSPGVNATSITATSPIEFSATQMAIYSVRLDHPSGHFVVFTNTNSITMPQVSEVPVPANATYTWFVSGWGPHTDINAVAAETALESVFKNDFEGPTHFTVKTGTRQFTTQ